MSELTKDQVIEWLSNLTVLQISEITKELEDKWGVSAAAPVAMVAGPAVAAAAEEVQTEFDVVLTQAGDKKIQVIKVVREITGLGLKEAKALVDEAPKPVKEGVSEEEAKEVAAKLADAGASVEVK